MTDQLWLYRVLEIEQDSDPLDIGIVQAKTFDEAKAFLQEHLEACLQDPEQVTVRLYKCDFPHPGVHSFEEPREVQFTLEPWDDA